MCAKETDAGEISNDIIIIGTVRYKIRKRLLQRIRKILQQGKAMLPMYWYDHLLDEFEIDLTEFL